MKRVTLIAILVSIMITQTIANNVDNNITIKKPTYKYKISRTFTSLVRFCMERLSNDIIAHNHDYRWEDVGFFPSDSKDVDAAKLFSATLNRGSETIVSGSLLEIKINGTWQRVNYMCGGDFKSKRLTGLNITRYR